MTDDNVSNLGYSSIVTYISFCVIFFTLKFVYFPEDSASWIILFLVLSFVLQLMNNISITANKNVCGTSNVGYAMYHTIIPWIFVFTVTALCLLAFPGWLRVFSNTFGLYAAQMYGLQNTISSIFTETQRNEVIKTASSIPDIQLLKAIDSVYSNPTTIVNELDPRTMKKIYVNTEQLTKLDKNKFYDKAVGDLDILEPGQTRQLFEWDSLSKLNPNFLNNPPSQYLIKELYHMTLLKDTVGYFFWFILIGSLSGMISVNSLLSSHCNSSKKTSFDIIFNKT